MINGCYVSIFLNKIITARDKDWEQIKNMLHIPATPLELEKGEIKLREN